MQKPTSLTYLNHILALESVPHTSSPLCCTSPLLRHLNDPDHSDRQHTHNAHEHGHDHHYSNSHPRHRRPSHSPPLLEALRRQHGEAKVRAKKGRIPERIVQPCEIVGRDVESGGHCAAGRIEERVSHGPEAEGSPKTVVGGEGFRGDSRGVEGEGEEGMVVVGNESWARIGRYLREGLAEGISWTDALGREVRGDGSLVG